MREVSANFLRPARLCNWEPIIFHSLACLPFIIGLLLTLRSIPTTGKSDVHLGRTDLAVDRAQGSYHVEHLFDG